MQKSNQGKFNPNISILAKFTPIYSKSRNEPSLRDSMLSSLSTMISIKEKSKYEYLSSYKDNFPFLKLRKAFLRILISSSILSSYITRSKLFEIFITLIILFNTLLLSLEDPSKSTQSSPYKELELFCLIIYTIESCLKILAQGLIFSKSSYFRDPLNIIDFIIVLTAWLDQFASQGFNLNALRVMRILKPLRSLTSISGLRVLILSLFESLVPLVAALVILIFCLLIFAVAGLQLFMGLFRSRCFDLDSGVYDKDSEVCDFGTCGSGVCVESLDNPWHGGLNFDNIYFAFIAVFQVITLEGWYSIMKKTQISFSFFSFLYFLPLVYFGSYLLVNLTQAIIAISFTNAVEETEKMKVEDNSSVHSSMLSESDEDGMIDETILMNLMENRKARKSYVMVFDRERDGDEEFENDRFIKAEDRDARKGAWKEQDAENGNGLAGTIYKRQSRMFKFIRNNSESSQNNNRNLKKIKKTLKISSNLAEKLKTKKVRAKDLKYLVKDYLLESSSSDDVIPLQKKSYGRRFKYSFCYKCDGNGNDNDEFCFLKEKKEKIRKIKEKFSEYLTQMEMYRFMNARFSSLYSFHVLNVYVREIVQEYLENDRVTLRVLGNHSVFDVLGFKRSKDLEGLRAINDMKYSIWSLGCWGSMQRLIAPLTIISEKSIFKHLMTICVIINVSCLCYDHYGLSSEDQQNLMLINDIFTFIFLAEFILKLLDLGIKNIFRDKMNFLDFAVIIGGLIEYFFNYGSNALNAFRAVRILRIFRLTKLMRILKPLRSLKKLLKIISKSLNNLAYLMLLLLIFCIIFTLLGMQIFGGEFDFPEKPRCDFDSFYSSFLCIFQVLSTENWNEILMNSIRSKGPAAALFFVIWIIIGNFVILNLILAILIQKFKKSPKDSDLVDVTKVRTKAKRYTRISKKKIDKKQRIIDNIREISDIDDDEITNIDQLYEKKITHVKSNINLIILSEKSYNLFSLSNPFRRFLIQISSSPNFDLFTLFIIFLNTIKLIWDTYNRGLSSDSSKYQASYSLDIIFTSIYTLEFLIKSISFGFIYGKTTYLSDNWNRADFLILIFSFFDITDSVHIPVIRVFRLIRTLRPLKFITHNIRMKIIVTALLESIFALSNVMIVILMTWLVFAILGVSLFSGKLYSCSSDLIESKELCEASGFEWKNSDFNFDNVYEALLVLFVISSQESWPDRMYEGIDTRASGLSPKRDASPSASLYFISSVLIGNMFLTNLFAAVVFSKFSEAKQSEESYVSLLLNKDQLLWIHIMNLITKESPKSGSFTVSKNKYRKLVYSCISHTYFEIFMTLVIGFNAISLSADYYEAGDSYSKSIEGINLACTYIFIIECAMKLFALGFTEYFYYHWNKFDFFVVLASIANLIAEQNSSSNLAFLRFAPQLIRIVRVLRITKIFRVFNFLRPLQHLIIVVSYALPNIINVLLLLSLIFMIFSILGSFLFGGINSGRIIDDYTNFNNFHQSLFTLWRVSTGEDYPLIMYDCVRQVGKASLIFFITFIGLTTFLMLDLFISIVIETYEDYEKNPDNMLINFSHKLEFFKVIWSKFTNESKGARIHYSLLPKLMIELGPELGVLKDMHSEKIIKTLSVMDMNIDNDGFTYFHDMLYAVMRRKYAFKLLNRQGEVSQNRILLRNEETKTKIKIARLRMKSREKLGKSGRLVTPLREITIKKGNTFISWMYLRMVFQALKKWKDRKKFDLSRRSSSLETSRLA